MSDDDVTPIEVPIIEVPTLCRCRRPRCTKANLDRWFAEKLAHLATGATEREFNPEWAKSICWTNREITECNMKPLQETPK